jgi:hypothetical protein
MSDDSGPSARHRPWRGILEMKTLAYVNHGSFIETKVLVSHIHHSMIRIA